MTRRGPPHASAPPTVPAARLGPLRPDDLPEAVRLSDGVGWNQTEADWRRLLELHPGGAFGAWAEGRLVATATVSSYASELHWIGMVIVEASLRGRGLGGAMLDAAVRAVPGAGEGGARDAAATTAAAAAGPVVGLDATAAGAPLYRSRGFVDVAPMDRWGGVLRVAGDAAASWPLRAEELPALLAMDRRDAGVDRHALLRRLASEEAVRVWWVAGADGPRGFAFLRPGRNRAHLGPLVARDDAAFSALLAAAATELAGAPVFVDAVRRETTSRLLAQWGLEPARRLIRMTQGGVRGALDRAPLRAATGLEWG